VSKFAISGFPVSSSLKMDDPFAPPPAKAPYFSEDLGAWVLSRHQDVLAAMRAAELVRGQGLPDARTRADAINALLSLKIQDLRSEIEEVTRALLQNLDANRSVDLVAEFLHPWSLELVFTALKSGRPQRRRIESIGRYFAGGSADGRKESLKSGSKTARIRHYPERAWLAIRQRVSQWHLRRLCRELQLPGFRSVFLGVTQTLPSFLANAWLDLLLHPLELQTLRENPELIGSAIDELLRHAGLVHTLERRAANAVELCGIEITQGQQVFLKVSSANRDPIEFADTNCLDFTRRHARHLALGAGHHVCVGASFVRLTAAIATTELLRRFPSLHLDESSITWRCGAVQSSPTAIMVRLGPVISQPSR
jgi:cytochrome P450